MSVRPGTSGDPQGLDLTERRAEFRQAVLGNLWMIDSHSSTVFRCLCVDASRSGMRLRVPLGYGVRAGQQYELTSHLPGQTSPPGLGLMVSRRAAVVRTKIVPSHDEYDVDVGVQLAPTRTAVVNNGDPVTAWA
jgi:hypothetical protein